MNANRSYGVAAAAVLGALAVPVFSMHLGFADAGNDAPTSTTRKAYDLMADAPGGVSPEQMAELQIASTAKKPT